MRIDHINIVTHNILQSRNFYVNILGMKEVFETSLEGEWFEAITHLKAPKAHCIFLQPDSKNCTIELLEYQHPATLEQESSLSQCLYTQGIRHIAFEVDNIELIYKKALEYGVEFISPPTKVPLELVPRGKTLCYLKAPDNIIVEFAHYQS